MTSLIRKVLRGPSKRSRRGQHDNGGHERRLSVPVAPPSPDLSALTPSELMVLRDVFRRQEEFDSNVDGHKEQMRASLVSYEEEVRRQASQKSRLRHADPRLCRLCYKTKFADGIGRPCYDCGKRACNKCGAYSKPTWNAKRQKPGKSRWRCTMCQMKRDVIALTGVWYHGGSEAQTPPSRRMKAKLSSSEIESSGENDNKEGNDVTPRSYGSDDDVLHHADIDDMFSDGISGSKRSRRRSAGQRRRSFSLTSDVVVDDVDDDCDVEQIRNERSVCRKQRQKRFRKRSRGETISEDSQKPRGDSLTVPVGDVSLPSERSSSTEPRESSDISRAHSDTSPCPDQARRCVFSATSPQVHKRHERRKHSGGLSDSSARSSVSRQGIHAGSHGDVHRARKIDTSAAISDHDSDNVNYGNPRDHVRGGVGGQSKTKKSPARSPVDRRVSDGYVGGPDMLTERMSYFRSRSLEQDTKDDKPFKTKDSPNNLDTCRTTSPSSYSQNETVPSHSSNTYHRSNGNKGEVRNTRHSTGHKTSQSKSYIGSPDLRQIRDSRRKRESGSLTSKHSANIARDRTDICGSVTTDNDSPTLVTLKSSRKKLLRQPEVIYGSSSSVFSECHKNPVGEGLSSAAPEQTSDREVGTSACVTPQKLSLGSRKQHLQSISPNSLSPKMAMVRSHGRSRSPEGASSVHLRPGSISPRSARTTAPSEVTSPNQRYQRRNTLPYCINIDTAVNKLHAITPRTVTLHRNIRDSNVRSNGLGMRVIGGRKDAFGKLGAFVAMVTKGGPADLQKIQEGDQICEWNGVSFADVTFEDVQRIVTSPSDVVKITVLRPNVIHMSREASPNLCDRQPIIIRSDSLPRTGPVLPDSLVFDRPKKRMLPKTPVEIKRDVRRISGRIWLQLDYDVTCHCLLVVLLRGENIVPERDHDSDKQTPNSLAMLHILPNRAVHDAKESDIQYGTKDPHWNETFIFANITDQEVRRLTLEVTVWNYKEVEDEFLGEVLLDLAEAPIDNMVHCYQLEDHDENSSPLPVRKKSFSISDSAISPVTSMEASSVYPSREPSPRSSFSVTTKDGNHAFKLDHRKREVLGGRERCDMSSSGQSSPVHSPTSSGVPMNSSMSSLVRKKLIAVTRLSNPFSFVAKRNSVDAGDASIVRSLSDVDLRGLSSLHVAPGGPAQPRRSLGNKNRIELLAPPQALRSSGSYLTDTGSDTDPVTNLQQTRHAPDGDDITSVLGPAQIAPKPSHETNVCGDIKMGFMVTKGQLEIDIVVVKGLAKAGLHNPPDTYVKTYLVEATKTVQKKKTQTVRACFDPIFRKTIKYSACNIHGRCIKVNVWEKQRTFDRKQCLGEAVVQLDNLDLAQHTMAWYKLFPLGATEITSSESLDDWPYQ